ncbi:hypothetical protein BGZ72_001005 [Mortierella alpina]|nr:hypothetical protein BGZ72_001005 [Mortierella alpina]
MVVKREDHTCKKDIIEVTAALQELSGAVKAFRGSNVQPVIDAFDEAIKRMDTGHINANAVGSIDATVAETFSEPIKDLEKYANAFVSDLKGAIHNIEVAKLCDVIRQKLEMVYDKCHLWLETMLGVITPRPSDSSKYLVHEVKSRLQESQTLVTEGNCVNDS